MINIVLVRLSPPQWQPNSRYNKKTNFRHAWPILAVKDLGGNDWGESVKKKKIRDKNLFSDSVE